MAWTLENYQDRVLVLVADQSPNADDITVWVNECLQELQPDARLEASATVPLVSGTALYTLPADLYQIKHLYATITGYSMKPRGHFDTDPGYRLWDGKLIIQPTPTAAEALTLEYYKLVNQLVTGADVPNIPAQFHDLPYLYAAMRAKQQDAEFGEAQMYAFEYKERRNDFTSQRYQTARTGFRRVRIVSPWE